MTTKDQTEPDRNIYPTPRSGGGDQLAKTILNSLDLSVPGALVTIQRLEQLAADWFYADPYNSTTILASANVLADQSGGTLVVPLALRPGDIFVYPVRGISVQLPPQNSARVRLFYGIGVCPFQSNADQRNAWAVTSGLVAGAVSNNQVFAGGAIQVPFLPTLVDVWVLANRATGAAETSILRPTLEWVYAFPPPTPPANVTPIGGVVPDNLFANDVTVAAIGTSRVFAAWRNLIAPISTAVGNATITPPSSFQIRLQDFGTGAAAAPNIQVTLSQR